MKLRIKSKLSLGLFSLFVVIVIIGGVGAFYMSRIGSQSREILKDNYESIQFSRAMMEALDRMSSNTVSGVERFEKNLALQERNITEPGEKELTQEIRAAFEQIKKGNDPALAPQIRQKLYQVIDVNMKAIFRKHTKAQKTISEVLLYMGLIGSICFLLVFTFIINFPGYIANPIRDLTQGIKQIANKNYSERLHFTSNDEFGELATAFNTMAQKLDDYENSNLARLMFEKKRIETIINSMKDPLIGLSEKNIILFVNEEAGKILGLREADLAGKIAPEVAKRNDLMRTLLLPELPVSPLKIVLDGKECYFSRERLLVSTRDEKDGAVIQLGEVIILKNITSFQEQDLAKTNFIATISHELKTPIASIKLSSMLLEDGRIGPVNPEQKELIGNIREEAGRLLKITGELLDMAQVETGRIQLSFQTVHPVDIINYATNALHMQAQDKEVVFEVEAQQALPTVYCDREKCAWVMVNLLSNAVRYSPEKGKIILSAKVLGENIEFSVRDFGKGIDPMYKEKIFDKYFQIPGSQKTGTGLGLAIAKEFITAQGGEIGLRNAEGPGSCFYFTLALS